MKKTSFIILSIIFIFSLSLNVKADCNDEELNEWATTIKPEFVLNNGEHALDYYYAYFLTVTPMRNDIKIEATDSEGLRIPGEKFHLMDLYGVGCYTNLKKETYTIKVYGGDNSKCKGELLRTLTYEVLPYNDMIKTEECENHPEHELCKTFTDKTQNMTREEFNEEIKNYEQTIKNNSFSFNSILNILKEYGVYILFPFFVISLIYIIKIQEFKKKESKK